MRSSKRRRGWSRPAYWSTRWQALARAVKDRDGWRCRECGGPGKLEAHHVRPVEDGGPMWEPENVITLCRDCHRRRHGAALASLRKHRPGWAALIDTPPE